MTEPGDMPDHEYTGFVFERDGLKAYYVIDDIDAGGVRCRRTPLEELGHEEHLTWNEFGRGIYKNSIRVYGFTEDEVQNGVPAQKK